MRSFWIIPTVIVIAACPGKADSLIVTLDDSAWGNTGISDAAPSAFVTSLGVCAEASIGGCSVFSTGSFLDPITFLPSSSPQSVTVKRGAQFSAVASAIGEGRFGNERPRILSLNGSVPTDFPLIAQSNGGDVYTGYPGADITSIVITIGAFGFQEFQSSSGPIWEAQFHPTSTVLEWDPGITDRDTPPLTIDVYAADPLPPYVPLPVPSVPEPSSYAQLVTALGLLLWLRRKAGIRSGVVLTS